LHAKPVLAKADMAFCKIRLYYTAQQLFLCLHLQHRRVIVPKMIIRSLPEIRVGRRNDLHAVFTDLITLGPARPLKIIHVHKHSPFTHTASAVFLLLLSSVPLHLPGRGSSLFLPEKRSIPETGG